MHGRSGARTFRCPHTRGRDPPPRVLGDNQDDRCRLVRPAATQADDPHPHEGWEGLPWTHVSGPRGRALEGMPGSKGFGGRRYDRVVQRASWTRGVRRCCRPAGVGLPCLAAMPTRRDALSFPAARLPISAAFREVGRGAGLVARDGFSLGVSPPRAPTSAARRP
jgi:hypothetical protein